jgi:hypothetical protein
LLNFNDDEEIKMKGISEKETSFEEFKNAFYKNKTIKFNKQFNLNKKNFYLERTFTEKNINFGLYDKRVFTKNKKSSKPHFFNYL